LAQTRESQKAMFAKNFPLQNRVNKTVTKQSLNDLDVAKSVLSGINKSSAMAIKEIKLAENEIRRIGSNEDRNKFVLKLDLIQDDIEKVRSTEIKEQPFNIRETERIDKADKRIESIKKNIDASGAFAFGVKNEALRGVGASPESMKGVINKKLGVRTKKERPEESQLRFIGKLR